MTRSIESIRDLLSRGEIEFSDHANDMSIERNISDKEIMETGSQCQIIENYPEDKYGPSCLLLGFTAENRPLHIHVSRKEEPILKVITLYEPDPKRWYNYRKRR